MNVCTTKIPDGAQKVNLEDIYVAVQRPPPEAIRALQQGSMTMVMKTKNSNTIEKQVEMEYGIMLDGYTADIIVQFKPCEELPDGNR